MYHHTCLVAQSCLSATSLTAAHQAGHGDAPGKNTSGLPCPLPGHLPNLGITHRSPTFQANSLPSEPPGKPNNTGVGSLSLFQGIFPTQE